MRRVTIYRFCRAEGLYCLVILCTALCKQYWRACDLASQLLHSFY